jgi:hypothetical protein
MILVRNLSVPVNLKLWWTFIGSLKQWTAEVHFVSLFFLLSLSSCFHLLSSLFNYLFIVFPFRYFLHSSVFLSCFLHLSSLPISPCSFISSCTLWTRLPNCRLCLFKTLYLMTIMSKTNFHSIRPHFSFGKIEQGLGNGECYIWNWLNILSSKCLSISVTN